MRRAVFIDRDDTILDTRGATASTDHVGDLLDPAMVRPLPGALEGCKKLFDAGYILVLVSNQGCVARGRASLRQVEAVNDRLRELLAEAGVTLAATYYCPHHPDAVVPALKSDHAWRKPQPGMYLAAAAELGVSLKDSWAIGDAARDVLSAVTAGIEPGRSIVIGKGPGIWHADLRAAADVIVNRPATPQ
jgi:D-glycero-D-manno-heptose 1,7-bisphosphate phosphatase